VPKKKSQNVSLKRRGEKNDRHLHHSKWKGGKGKEIYTNLREEIGGDKRRSWIVKGKGRSSSKVRKLERGREKGKRTAEVLKKKIRKGSTSFLGSRSTTE